MINPACRTDVAVEEWLTRQQERFPLKSAARLNEREASRLFMMR
jgi:hypothetical protein